jgi:phosphoglycolate phosphatase
MALEALGRSAPPAAELNWIIGPPLRGCFAEALGGEGDPEEALQLYRGRYATTGLFEAVVYDGVRETLAELRARGMRLFLCTAKPLVYAERILTHFDLERHFEAAYGDELGGRFQDKADLIAHILDREGLKADDCCMWGDRKHDVLAASRNGIPTIGALWGYGGADELRAAGAAALCEAPSQVPAAFWALPRAASAGA